MRELDPFNVEIGARIREARSSAGLTQAELAERTNLSTQFISSIERGVYRPSLPTLRDICLICNTSSDFILCGIDKDHEIPFVVQYACSLPEQHLEIYKSYTSTFLHLLSMDPPADK